VCKKQTTREQTRDICLEENVPKTIKNLLLAQALTQNTHK